MGEYGIITRKTYNLRNLKSYVFQKYEQLQAKEEKSADVKKLLDKHFSLDWEKSEEDLQYYIDFFARREINHEPDSECKYVGE